MAIYHILLFKTTTEVNRQQLDNLFEACKMLENEVPGVQTVKASTALPATVAMAKGFNVGVVMLLEQERDLEVLRKHPSHDRVSKLAGELTTDKLVIDLEV